MRHLMLSIMLLVLIAGPVMADWQLGDGHKMHFPQLPDVGGWDVNATLPLTLADDWTCSETGSVREIHFWGSWRQGQEAPISSFVLRIFANVPANPPQIPFSRPGALLWEYETSDFVIAIPSDPPDSQGWYDPASGVYQVNDHLLYYQYNVLIAPSQWFWQEQDSTYWLGIVAIIDDVQAQWGWKSTQDHYADDAVWGNWYLPSWEDLWEPPDFTQSLDLAFVITAGQPGRGACCIPGPETYYSLCVETTEDSCVNELFGRYEGDGSECAGMQACCLYDGSCIHADSLCCVLELQGWPQGPGSGCNPMEACCLPGGECINADPQCCEELGGTPQGAETWCTDTLIACCLQDGSGDCLNVDPICCDDLGGIPSPIGAPSCLGDLNGNGVDDACELQVGACCFDDGSCMDLPESDCNNLLGEYKGDGTECLGDTDSTGVDDACEGWEPGDDHKMHYPQLPDEAGWDVLGCWPTVLADDWRCRESGWVKDIHLWGSWLSGLEGEILNFSLAIYSDVPAEVSPTGYSTPGELLWNVDVTSFGAIPIHSQTFQGWYNPPLQQYFIGDHQRYYQYNIFLPREQWFWQEKDSIYWLSVVASVDGTAQVQWGWKSSLDRWNDDAVWSDAEPPYFWQELYEPPEFDSSLNLAFVITGDPGLVDSCEYYKNSFRDYAPNGVPDFDQKQDLWQDAAWRWTHCGPVSLANCFWWFDSKYEPNPIDPRPFWPDPGQPPPNDGYGLVTSLSLMWDDHDRNNVMPLVDSLALYCNTNQSGVIGTSAPDLVQGATRWLRHQGVADSFTVDLYPEATFAEIKHEVERSQNVLLLLGFYEDHLNPECCRLGGHWVTVAGVCTTEAAICVCDPYFDMHEGEPPLGAHSSDVHNDAYYISGPHGGKHHDKYFVGPPTSPCLVPAAEEVYGYPIGDPDIYNFLHQNPFDPGMLQCEWLGGRIYTVIEAAVSICPCDCVPGDADGNHILNISDAVYLISYIFGGGPPPVPYAICSGDADCNCIVNISDAVYMITYIFGGGPPPCTCLEWLGICGPPLRN